VPQPGHGHGQIADKEFRPGPFGQGIVCEEDAQRVSLAKPPGPRNQFFGFAFATSQR